MKNHPVIHFEIGCHGSEKARVFFTQLFGWEISDRDAGMMINTGGDGAISGHITDLAAGEWGTYVTFYVQIEDLEIYLKKANELGGKTLVPPVTLPGRGSFAWLAPPEGNIIGIWKRSERELRRHKNQVRVLSLQRQPGCQEHGVVCSMSAPT